MLSFNRIMKGMAYSATVVGLLTALAACTVQPLYSGGAGGDGLSGKVAPAMRSKLASIAIDSPDDRMTQMVRNRLVYLLSGGAGQPSSAYQLTLNVSVQVQQAIRVNIGDQTDREGRASAGTVIASSSYVLKDMKDRTLFMRKRSVASSFDRPRQEYANLQAEQDAKKRAAEELAERIYLSLTRDLARQ